MVTDTASRFLPCILGIVAIACGSPNLPKQAMTAAEHDRAASAHLATAREEDAQYDPEDRPGLPCLLAGMRGNGACESKRHKETAERREVAERERKQAADHNSAAAALREAEDRVCRGLSDRERDDGPLATDHLAYSAQPLIDYDYQATVFGVVMAFGPEVVDVDRLQSAVECHRARIASRGILTPTHDCPLDDSTLTALVVATPRGPLLQLRSEDPVVARRTWERARRAAHLASPSLRKPAVRRGGGS